MKWDNVRPVGADEELRVLRIFNAVQSCSGAPVWAAFACEPEDIKPVTIVCGRCGQAHTYRTTATNGRRKYCDGCVRT